MPRKTLKALLWSFVALLTLSTVALAVLLLIDVGIFRERIEAAASAALDRQVTIGGDMRLEPSLFPRLSLQNVRIANPHWGSRANFATARRVDVVMDLMSLLSGQVVISELKLERANVHLEEGPNGATTWDFGVFPKTETNASPSLPSLKSVLVYDTVVTYRRAGATKHVLRISHAQGAFSPHSPVELRLSGAYQGLPMEARLRGGTLKEFIRPVEAWPVAGTIAAASARLTMSGHLARPIEFAGLTLDIDLKGDRLDELEPALGIALPRLRPYALSAELSVSSTGYSIDDLRLRAGNSRLSGVLEASTAAMPPQITGELVASRVDLEEILGSLPRIPIPATEAESRFADWTRVLNGVHADLKLHVEELMYSAAPLRHIGIHLATRQAGADPTEREDGLKMTGSALWQGLPLKASFHGGALAELIAPTHPWPLQGNLETAGVSIAIDGTISQPLRVEGLDVALTMRGHDLQELGSLLGAELPAVGAYALSSRARFAAGNYRLEKLEATAGGSDFAGRITLSTAQPRPTLTGELASNRLDLGALLPALPPSKSAAATAAAAPDSPLPLSGRDVSGLDASLVLNVARVAHPGLSADDVSLRLVATNGELALDPIRFRLSGAAVSGKLHYRPAGPTPSLTLEGGAKKLAISQLVRLLPHPPPVTGEVNDVHIRLSSAGRTWRELLDNADLSLKGGQSNFTYAAAQPLSVTLRSSELSAVKGGPVTGTTEAVFRETPLSIELRSQELSKLIWDASPWPVRFQVRGANTSLKGDGSVDWRAAEANWQVKLQVAGKRLSDLSRVAGAKLPEAGPFRLNGQLQKHEAGFRLTDLSARVGETRARGTLSYTRKITPWVVADVTVDTLQVADFWKPAAHSTDEPLSDRVIPQFDFSTDKLHKLDGRFKLKFKQILAGQEVLGASELEARLSEGHLIAYPLTMTGEKTNFLASLEIQSSRGVAAVKQRVNFRTTEAGRILAGLGIAPKLVAALDLRGELSGRGRNLRELLAHSRGKVTLVGGKGRIPRRLLNLWGGGLIRALLPTNLLAKNETDLNCAVARFKIDDGMAGADAIVIDTTDIIIGGHGAVDLGTEEVRAVFQPAPKRRTLVTLGSPVIVTGTLANPIIRPESGRTLLRVGELAIGFLNPAYLVLLTADTGTAEQNPCLTAIARRDAGVQVDRRRGVLNRSEGFLQGILDRIRGGFNQAPQTFE